MVRRPAVQVPENEWVTIEWINQHEECCNCGAKHAIDYQVIDGKLQMRARAKRRGV